MRFIVFLILLSIFSIESYAVKIQFPEDELASESVLPKFDNPEPVKNRNIMTKGRFEITGMFGWTLNDVFVDPLTFGGIATYHFTEIHGLQFYYNKFSAKENDYPSQIDSETGVDIPNPAVPDSAMLLAYQITPYYGKLSLTKQGVTNMSFYGTAGIGTYAVSGDNSFAMSAGLGSKIYLTKRFNIRLDYRWFFFNAKDPINEVDQGSNGSIDKTLPDRAQFNSILTVGAGFLF
ncbi:MAG: outer membrane beta-barrel domain-containing protein [Bdellovibrionota bacterium]